MWWWAAPAFATWTVAGIDPETGEVGVAGATCGPFVWMVAELVPGEGAVAAQYATWVKGKGLLADALAAGDTPEEALAGVATAKVDDKVALRQYGVVGFAGPAAGFTGDEVEGAHAWLGDDVVSVQGNTLRGEDVVEDAFAAFHDTAGGLDERLLAALEAGRDAGGDARCPVDEPEKSAFLFTATEDGDETKIRASTSLRSMDPIDRVRAEWEGSAGCDATAGPATGGLLAPLLGLLAARRRRARPHAG
jgi:uncharacterized Ntn-hydrolase superfamily protein